jgi:hypothetical protein
MDSSSASEASRTESGIPPKSLLVAALAACVGALAWAAVSFFTGYEVGYVAWALGGLVGLAMARLGGRGVTSASAAAALAVAGIAGGKLLGTRFVVEKELRTSCEATFTPELHGELVIDAADFARLSTDPTEEEIRLFLVEHRYTGADEPDAIEDEELRAFHALQVPMLRAMRASSPSYEDWYAEREAESRRAFEESFSIVRANLDGLNGLDLLFVALGVSTAFGIVRRAGAPTAPDAAARPTDQRDARKAA